MEKNNKELFINNYFILQAVFFSLVLIPPIEYISFLKYFLTDSLDKNNIYIYPPLYTSLLFYLYGLYIYFKNPNSFINITFSLLWFCFTIWLAGYPMVFPAANPQTAILWSKIVYSGVIFISPAFYSFTVELLELEGQKRYVTIGYVTGIIFLFGLFFTDFFIKGLYNYYWGFYPKAGFLHTIFLMFFSLLYIKGLFNLYNGSKRNLLKAPIECKKYRYIFWAFTIALVGAVDYLPKYGIEHYPIGYMIVGTLLFSISYIIVQYRFMDIQTVIHKTILWGITSSVVIIPIYLLILFGKNYIINQSPAIVALSILPLFFLYSLYFKYVQPRIDHIFQRKKYDLQTVIKQFTDELSILKELFELIEKINNTISTVMYINKPSIILFYNNKEGISKKSELKDKKISSDHPFLSWLVKNDGIVELDQLDMNPFYNNIKESGRPYFFETGAQVVIPIIYDKKIIAVINLGKKLNLKDYTATDIELLKSIKTGATIAIANSILYDQVAKQNIELKKMDKLKSEMLANTSHELKTPINQIKGIIEEVIYEIEMEKGSNSNKSIVDDLRLIAESGEELRKKVNDILESSKIASSQKIYNFVDFDLKGLVDISILYSIKTLNSTNKKEKIKLYQDIPDDLGYIFGDQGSINTVLDNLLRNAIKFTEKGEIKVSARLIEKSDLIADIGTSVQTNKYVMVSVKDTGVGITDENLEIIFEQFRQVDGSFSRKHGGTGLGLYICKNIIESHFGSIWVDSTLGKGATFNFILPLEHENMDRRMGPERRKSDDRRRIICSAGADLGVEIELDEKYKSIKKGNGETILVVDDEPKNLSFLKKILIRHGYKVITANGGKEGLEKLYENYHEDIVEKIELIILDLMMPKITGYDFCKEIRRKWGFRFLPVIMLTVMDEFKYYVYSCNLGADEYISKPFARDILLAKVSLLLKKSHTEQTLNSMMEIGKVLVSQYELDKIIDLSVNEIKRLIHADKISIMLVREDEYGKFLKIEKNIGSSYRKSLKEKIRYGDSIAGYVWEKGTPLLIKDITSDSRFVNIKSKGVYKTNSFIISPVICNGEVLGIVCVGDKFSTHEFNVDDLNFLIILSDYIAVAINKINDLKKIKEQNKIIMNKKNLEFMAETVDWVGHEVNSPAQAIMANADLLFEYLSEDQMEKPVTNCLNNISDLCYRIRNVCEIIRGYGESGVKAESFSVKNLITRVLEYARMNLFDNDESGVTITSNNHMDSSLEIFGDVGMMELAIFNMIKNSYNSIIFRKKKENINGQIKLSCYSVKNNIYILIEDNGVGIEEKDISNIFNRNFSSNGEGWGIGLFLVQKVVKDHGGRIEVESDLGKYSRLTIILPVKGETSIQVNTPDGYSKATPYANKEIIHYN